MHRRRPDPTSRPGSFLPPDSSPRGRRVCATKPPAGPSRPRVPGERTHRMIRRTLAVVALTLVAGAVLAGALVPACQAQTANVTALSRPSAKVGARLTIRGSHFGSRQGDSTVTFGERPNALGFAPCSKKARVISWSSSSITVRVPGLAPGSHRVYVTVGGRASNGLPVQHHAAHDDQQQDFVTSSDHGYWVPQRARRPLRRLHLHGHQPQHRRLPYGVRHARLWTHDQRITFLNCTFTGNTGVGSGGIDYGVNGVKVNNWGAGETSTTSASSNCTFGQFSRMGYEQVNDTAAHAAQRVAFCRLRLRAHRRGADQQQRGDLYQLIDGCTFKGSGNSIGSGAVWRNHRVPTTGQYLEMRNCHIWACTGGAFNFQDVEGVRPPYLSSRTRTSTSRTPTRRHSRSGTGGILRDARHQLRPLRRLHVQHRQATPITSRLPAGQQPEVGTSGWYTCSHIDFSGSTITGYIQPVAALHPVHGRGYWDAAGQPDEHLAHARPLGFRSGQARPCEHVFRSGDGSHTRATRSASRGPGVHRP